MDEVAGSGNDLIKEIGEMKSQNNVKVVGIAGLSGAGRLLLFLRTLKITVTRSLLGTAFIIMSAMWLMPV